MKTLLNYIIKLFKNYRNKYILGSFLGGFLALFFIVLSLFVSVYESYAFNGNRDNDNFLSGYFWQNKTDDQDIVEALFGNDANDRTAYTTGWNSNYCAGNYTSVIYLTGGTDKLPSMLVTDTIYVLNSGTYIMTYPIHLYEDGISAISHCSAIVGSGDVTIYTDTQFSTGVFVFYRQSYFIFDNIKFNGSENGVGGSHASNSSAIGYKTDYPTEPDVRPPNAFYNLFNNIEIQKFNLGLSTYQFKSSKFNNIKAHNNVEGLNFYMFSRNNTISNSQFYDNIIGINLYSASSNTVIQNSQFYNNSSVGIRVGKTNNLSKATYYTMSGAFNIINNNLIYNNGGGISIGGSRYSSARTGLSSYNTINNNQIFNNKDYGLFIDFSNNNVINNNQIYNNNGNGVVFAESSNNIINNTYIYNNNGQGISIDTNLSTGNKYYGSIKLFNNINDDQISLKYPTSFVPGTGLFDEFGRTTGEIDTDVFGYGMSCIRATNPRNINHNFLSSYNCNTKGQISEWTGEASGYVYFPFIMKQIAPVMYYYDILTGSSLSYTTSKYIGEINPLLGGATSIDPWGFPLYATQTGGHTLLVTSSFPSHYSITGNFTLAQPLVGNITGSLWTIITGITLSDGTGDKYFYGTFTTGSLPTGYHTNKILFDPNPPDCTEVFPECCVENLDTVSIANINTLPSTLSGNTIYLIQSGTHTLSSFKKFNNKCTLLKGVGNVIITTSSPTSYMFYSTGITTVIDGEDGPINQISPLSSIGIQNIKFDGKGIHAANNYGVSITNTETFRLFDSVFYNTITGLLIQGESTDNLLTHSQFYNNRVGLEITHADHNLINNLHIYNNSGYGIVVHDLGDYNSFNNNQIYKNGSGILFSDSNSGIIANSQIYNNQNAGMSFDRSFGNSLANVRSYNNAIGIAFDLNSVNNLYYNAFNLFDNRIADYVGTDTHDVHLNQGNVVLVGRGPGILNTSYTINPQYTTNPYNYNGQYLLSGYKNEIPGINAAWAPTHLVSYMYMPGILKQLQPIIYTQNNTIVKISTGYGINEIYEFWTGTKYIAELNPKYNAWTGNTGLVGNIILAANKFYTTVSGNIVNLYTSEPAAYTLTGDFTTSPIVGTIGASQFGTASINLITGFSDLYVLFTTGSKSYAQHIVINFPYIIYFPTSGSWTSGDVTVILTGYTPSYDNLTLTNGPDNRTMVINGSTGFILQDTGGYILPTITGTVTWIDKLQPVFTGVVTGTIYGTSPTITFHDTGGAGILSDYAIISGLDNSFRTVTFTSGSLFSRSTGTYLFIVTDRAGNSTGAIFTMNTIAPDGPTCIPGSTGFVTSISVSCFTGVGGTHIRYTTGVSIPSTSSSLWSSPTIFSITTTLNVVSCNSVIPENCSAPVSYVYTQDNEPPTAINALSGLFSINSGAIYVTGLSVTLLMNVTGADYMNFQNSGDTSRSATGAFFPSTGWLLVGPDGTGYVHGRFRDILGNRTGYTDSIILDRQTPTFTQSNGSPITSGTTYASLTIIFGDATSGISGAILSGMDINYYSGDFQSGVTLNSNGTYQLTVVDGAGNATGVTFIINSSSPGIPHCVPGVAGGIYRYSGSTIAIDCFVGRTGDTLYYTNTTVLPISDPTTGSSVWTSALPLTNSTGYLKVMECTDAYICSPIVNYTYIQDTVPPTAVASGFQINTGALYTNTTSVWFTNISGADRCNQMSVSYGTTIINQNNWTGNLSNKAVTLNGPDGLNMGYVRFKDCAGNIAGPFTDTIILDRIAPIFSGNGVAIVSGTTYTGLLITFMDPAPASGISGNAAIISGLDNAYLNTGFTSGSYFTGGTIIAGRFLFIITDNAGNTTGVTFVINNTPPPPPVVHNGGGTPYLQPDNCKRNPRSQNNLSGANASGIDYSLSYYDRTCLPSHQTAQVCDVSKSPYSNEITNAFDWAYSVGITTLCPISASNVNGFVKRKEMAKMVTVFATKVMGLQPDTKRKCTYGDMSKESAEMKGFAILACQLKIMGLEYDGSPDTTFRPNGLVTRAQFGTILSRLLYGTKYNGDRAQRYGPHLAILKKNKIMNDISQPAMQEKRGYIMIMLMRSAGGNPALAVSRTASGSSIGSLFGL